MFQVTGVGTQFLIGHQIEQKLVPSINRWGSIKIKGFCTEEGTIGKAKGRNLNQLYLRLSIAESSAKGVKRSVDKWESELNRQY